MEEMELNVVTEEQNPVEETPYVDNVQIETTKETNNGLDAVSALIGAGVTLAVLGIVTGVTKLWKKHKTKKGLPKGAVDAEYTVADEDEESEDEESESDD